MIERVDGSSPRERGTPQRNGDAQFNPRFIPARAGNASGARARWRPAPVHPRASGERQVRFLRLRALVGSSPRERGTPRVVGSPCQDYRFIPARAGNANAHCRCPLDGAVHPRASGERSFWKSLIWRAIYDVKQRTGKLGIFRLPATGFGCCCHGWQELHQL